MVGWAFPLCHPKDMSPAKLFSLLLVIENHHGLYQITLINGFTIPRHPPRVKKCHFFLKIKWRDSCDINL